MKRQKRTFERVPVNLKAALFCGDSKYSVTIHNCTENGMCIGTMFNCMPCSYKVELLLPLGKKISRLPAKISRIVKLNDINYIIGIEILNPSGEYLEYIDGLRKISKSFKILYS